MGMLEQDVFLASRRRWENIGTKEPTTGVELSNEKLTKALSDQLVLTKERWDVLDVKGLRLDHFIQSGGMYFKPTIPATIQDAAIDAVAGGTEVQAAVDAAVRNERLRSALEAAAAELKTTLTASQLKKLQDDAELVWELSLDDRGLMSAAKERLK
eukprot:4044640-Prymnesium_polylepis.1